MPKTDCKSYVHNSVPQPDLILVVVQLFPVFEYVVMLRRFGNRLIKSAPCGSRWPEFFTEELANTAET